MLSVNDDKRDLMVIKRVIKSKAAQRKGAISNWKVNQKDLFNYLNTKIQSSSLSDVGKLVLYLLKEQQTTADHVRLRRVSHQSVVLKPKAQFDHMLETLAWERDIDLSGPKTSISIESKSQFLFNTKCSRYQFSHRIPSFISSTTTICHQSISHTIFSSTTINW